ncbi:deoxyhypusine synthase [Archaeoglobus veneficus]|uniref:Deoxyhypusine synthase n=1 Tax=Archaeoglobus veneficus (strain DSM 11195 / SNP6) TaxID=693661 RepID=F2KMH1_ARCVS|nr:deoxyhypusine synthase [Archaeoglobus veneficus]AEA47168.1 deoxyhypusine synthase [Archaeoglobus veneficus SNP6]
MQPTEPIEVSEKSVADLLLAMSKTGFQGRKLGEAFKVWLEMLEEDEITILMGLAGAMVPAGMRKIIAYLIRNRYIDVLISTGANLFHDIHEALGFRHYLGSENVDDFYLYNEGIDRIYDVFAYESEFNKVDCILADIISELDGVVSSRKFIGELAARVYRLASEKESIIVAAYESGVPVFCPAIADSSIGIAAAIADRRVVIDTIKDVEELTDIVVKSKKTGVIYVSGGVPKNFIQQTEVVARLKGVEKGGHDYAIQFTTDMPQWGGLSGCTFEEGISWGKISQKSKKVQVHVDATIALPVIVHGLQNVKRRSCPVFIWDRELKIDYGCLSHEVSACQGL